MLSIFVKMSLPFVKLSFMKKLLHALFLTFACLNVATAQVSSIPFSQALDTFQVISGTQVDQPNADDIFYPNIPIGFPFTYNGTVTNKIGLCTNGFIAMDSLMHSSLWTPNANNTNQVAVLWADLMNSNAGGSLEYSTIGVAPNRICIVQWKDYSIFGLPYCHLNAQIWLHETSNCIQLVYGYNALSGNNGRTFYVGLTGNTTADYQLRTTASSWINSTPALTYPGAGMFLNPLAFLPNGLVYSFGSCPAGGTPFSYITGNVYLDANNNGSRDAGENGLSNKLVHDNTQNYYALTDTAGNYALAFIDSQSTYAVHAIPPMYWNTSSTPATYSIQPLTQATNNRDFGLHPTPNVHDVQIMATSFPPPFPNGTINMVATYHNTGTVIEPGDSIFLVKDSHYSFTSANPAPAYVSGDSLVWTYSNLLLNEYRNIHLQLHADTTIQAGDTLHSFWTINPIATDAAPADNHFAMHQLCFASFDPNSKEVSPEGDILNTQELTYTIHFQNTGNFPAQNVFIHDTLDSDLDMSTFNLKAYSHPMTYTVSGQGRLTFTFAGINLPDSLSNEPGSHGHIVYSIKLKPGLPAGTHVTNTADIVFDFNAPVVTNTTLNIIVENTPNGVGTQAELQSVQVYPNPVGQLLYIQSPTDFSQADVRLFDVTGKMLTIESSGSGKLIKLNVEGLPQGTYFLSITDQGKTTRRKITKQ